MSQIGYEMTTNVVELGTVITSVIYPLSCCCQIYINDLSTSRQDYEDPYSNQETGSCLEFHSGRCPLLWTHKRLGIERRLKKLLICEIKHRYQVVDKFRPIDHRTNQSSTLKLSQNRNDHESLIGAQLDNGPTLNALAARQKPDNDLDVRSQ